MYQQKALGKGLTCSALKMDACSLLGPGLLCTYPQTSWRVDMMGSQEATGLESFHLAFACPFKYLPHFEDPLSQVGMEAVGC